MPSRSSRCTSSSIPRRNTRKLPRNVELPRARSERVERVQSESDEYDSSSTNQDTTEEEEDDDDEDKEDEEEDRQRIRARKHRHKDEEKGERQRRARDRKRRDDEEEDEEDNQRRTRATKRRDDEEEGDEEEEEEEEEDRRRTQAGKCRDQEEDEEADRRRTRARKCRDEDEEVWRRRSRARKCGPRKKTETKRTCRREYFSSMIDMQRNSNGRFIAVWILLVGLGIAGTVFFVTEDDETFPEEGFPSFEVSAGYGHALPPSMFSQASVREPSAYAPHPPRSPAPPPPSPSPRPPFIPCPPGEPPSHPPVLPLMGSVVERLNTRFKEGARGKYGPIDKFGVLVHHFDNQASKMQPWLPCQETCYGVPCWCAPTRDRLSATLINAKLPRRQDGGMPTYHDVESNAAAGFVLNPYFTRILCSYPGDGGTMNRICHPPGVSATCVPGCHRFADKGGGENWCNPNNGGAGACAYEPSVTGSMLALQRSLPSQGGQLSYNEIVIDFAYWQHWQPRSIEAVWFMGRMPGCGNSGGALMCEKFARQVHSSLLSEFSLTREQLPLILLDQYDWKTPFSLVES